MVIKSFTARGVNDTVTAGVAAGGITFPVWASWIGHVSTVAEFILPILGAVWLIIQIIYRIKDYNHDHRDED